MILTLSNAVLNNTVTLLLGFIAGWHHDFDGKQAVTLDRMVMLYALPLSLLAAMLGPGAINPLLSVADAQTDSAPVLAITAHVGLNRIYMESYQIVDLVSTPIRCERNEP